jgi:hypothetical protein
VASTVPTIASSGIGRSRAGHHVGVRADATGVALVERVDLLGVAGLELEVEQRDPRAGRRSLRVGAGVG